MDAAKSKRSAGLRQHRDIGDVNVPLGVPCIVGTLQPDPEDRFITEQLPEPDGDSGADWFALRQNVIEVLAPRSGGPEVLDVTLKCSYYVLVICRADAFVPRSRWQAIAD
ncbi:hypothetical protein [Breoghania sp. JC706]|uniref:hypothetical protein n=1 Tax=Breoghania sp. JC706 TaxID=3117732 RepID=UPI0030095752